MALVLDTGPLYASLDADDAFHQVSRDLILTSVEPLVIPAPVLVEVDYLVHKRLDQRVFSLLLEDIEAGAYEVEDLLATDYARVREICSTYRDLDIGFVDAAVMAVVERLGETKLATLDLRHFRVVRPKHLGSLELLPG